MVRRNGDGARHAKNQAQAGGAEDAAVHDEAHIARAGGHDQHGVDEADVVGHQKGRPRGGHVLHAPHLEAVSQPRNQLGRQPQQQARGRAHGVKGCQHIPQPHGGKQRLRGKARAQQQRGQHAGGNHEQRVEDVVGRNHARAALGRGLRLNQRVKRHAVDARAETEQRQIRHHAPVAGAGHEFGHGKRRAIGHGGQRLHGGIQVNGKHAHADGPQRRQARLHVPVRELFAPQRACAYAH